ncbi:RAD51-like protein c-like protein [Paraphysoderma sedebokerense]|nr:RAD51-like protein c-like protein [Paraphysoderma sedebokerense]
MSSRPISTLNLNAAIKQKLIRKGFRFLDDLVGLSPEALCNELSITTDVANQILNNLKSDSIKSISALEIFAQESSRKPVTTLCSKLDQLLGGGGVPIGKITEVCGLPGLGKTQLGMQVAVNANIPSSLGGSGGKAIYIDTEGSFTVSRVNEIANATIGYVNSRLESMSSGDESKLKLDDVLTNLHYYRIHDYVELVGLVNILEDVLKDLPDVRIIVVDSIAAPFRNFSDMALRTRLLNTVSQLLMKVAEQFELAVLLTNQMTTKVNRGGGTGGDNESHVVPALGESWGHASTNRVILYYKDDVRHAYLFKSPNLQACTVRYQITSDGIRDVDVPNCGDLRKRKFREDFDEE